MEVEVLEVEVLEVEVEVEVEVLQVLQVSRLNNRAVRLTAELPVSLLHHGCRAIIRTNI